jgi:hypothetical protein
MEFGNWEFNKKNLTLRHSGAGKGYEIDLEECTTSAGVLDWIFQIESKTWASEEDLGYLVRALNVLLAPQDTLCSGGHEKGPIDDVRKVIERNLELRHIR